MKSNNKYLIIGGIFSLGVAILHIAIIIGGGDWYRFFGAGEEMALMYEGGSWYPIASTFFIALIFAIWGLYAFSGAGLIRKIPLSKLALVAISAIYLLRGLVAIPLVIFIEHPYMQELGNDMTFMLVSSFVSFVFGLLYALGTVKFWSSLANKNT